MRWIYRGRQGWLAIGTVLTLLGGSDGRQIGQAAAATLDSVSAARRGLAGPRSPADGMPLTPGGNVSGMPIALPEEQVLPMPGR